MKLIKFEQNMCAPCKVLKNYLENELKVQVDETVNLTTDGDSGFELAGMYGVMKTPTLLLIDDNGAVVDRFSGVDHNGVKAILAKRGLI